MKAKLFMSSAIVVAGLLFAASASAQTVSCDTVTLPEAGGEITGSWTFGDVLCADIPNIGSMVYPGCAGATQTLTLAVEGTTTFNADGTYTRSGTMTTAGDVSVPMTCVEGAGQTCTGGPAGAANVVGDQCVITLSQAEQEDNTGTYSVTGGSVQVIPSDSDPVSLTVYPSGDPNTIWVEARNPTGEGRVIMTLVRAQ